MDHLNATQWRSCYCCSQQLHSSAYLVHFIVRNFGVGVNFPFSIDVSKLNFDPLFFVVCFIPSSANLSTFNCANRQSKCDGKSEECRALFTDQWHEMKIPFPLLIPMYTHTYNSRDFPKLRTIYDATSKDWIGDNGPENYSKKYNKDANGGGSSGNKWLSQDASGSGMQTWVMKLLTLVELLEPAMQLYCLLFEP